MSPEFKAKFFAWYDRNIVAGWYRSLAVLAGWALGAVMFLPNIIDFLSQYAPVLTDIALPHLSPESKSILTGLFLSIGLPALRAWQQKKMQTIALKQAVKRGDVVPTGVVGGPVDPQ